MKRLTDDRGNILVFAAMVLMVLLLLAGLVIDFGRAYLVQAQLQAAIDAAALAGAGEVILKMEDLGEDEVRMWYEINPNEAQSEALRVFGANASAQDFDRQGIALVSVVINVENGNQVRVTVVADIQTFLVGPLMKVVDNSTSFMQLRLRRTAVAEARGL